MIDMQRVENAVREILIAIGEDVNRQGLADTPNRIARFWKEYCSAGAADVKMSLFETTQIDQMIVVRNIETWSMCEHHLFPFKCLIHIAYIPNRRVLGLSKFPRICKKYSSRLQIQERLTNQIASEVIQSSGSENVAVVIVGQHTCVCARGALSNSQAITSYMSGCFRKNEVKNEFMNLCAIQ